MNFSVVFPSQSAWYISGSTSQTRFWIRDSSKNRWKVHMKSTKITRISYFYLTIICTFEYLLYFWWIRIKMNRICNTALLYFSSNSWDILSRRLLKFLRYFEQAFVKILEIFWAGVWWVGPRIPRAPGSQKTWQNSREGVCSDLIVDMIYFYRTK